MLLASLEINPFQGYEAYFLGAYFFVLAILAIFGSHRYKMVYLYYKHKGQVPEPLGKFDQLPQVTVQLPIFNEMYVVERLLEKVAALEYPKDKLHIQVLDDSTDETVDIAAAKVKELEERGHDIVYIHRIDREGYKAGALAAGMKSMKGEFLAIFDADFVPQPDFLQKTMHYFTNPKVGMVQSRWGHLNMEYSLLTQIQSIFLDGHMIIEQTARNRSGLFFNFMGTGGVWRRQAIEDGGGWSHDTVTEDLDLSFRSQLEGWQFVFLPDLISPAELPVDIQGFKSQQHRWVKGGIQTCKKLLPVIWQSDASWKIKIEATFQLTMNFAYPLMVLLSILMLPAVLMRFETSVETAILLDLPIFFGATSSIFAFYISSQKELYQDWWERLKYMPLLVSVGIGLSINNAKAVFEGLMEEGGEFVRTPKYAIEGKAGSWRNKKYSAVRSLVPVLEFALGVYFTFTLFFAIETARYLSIPFLLLFVTGFFYVALQPLFGREEDEPLEVEVEA